MYVSAFGIGADASFSFVAGGYRDAGGGAAHFAVGGSFHGEHGVYSSDIIIIVVVVVGSNGEDTTYF